MKKFVEKVSIKDKSTRPGCPKSIFSAFLIQVLFFNWRFRLVESSEVEAVYKKNNKLGLNIMKQTSSVGKALTIIFERYCKTLSRKNARNAFPEIRVIKQCSVYWITYFKLKVVIYESVACLFMCNSFLKEVVII